MKKIISLFIVLFYLTFSGYSQDPFTVNELTEGKQWQIIEKAMADNGYEIGKFIPAENVIYSNWVTWNSLTIQNRGLVQIKLLGNKASISMVKRSYKTKDGWTDAIGKLSKKNKKKYLLSLSERINKINSSESFKTDAVQNSILFPAFKPVNTVRGLEFTLNYIYQDLESNDKPLSISFTLKNNTDVAAKMEINFWGSHLIFLGVPVRMENYNLKEEAGYGFNRFIQDLKPNETATFSAHYKCSGVITKIPKYNLGFRVNGKRVELIIHDIMLPYNDQNIEVSNNNLNTTNQTGNQEQQTPQGIYENFAIVKTGNPEMQLMAIHEDGSMIGFQLDENHERALSLTFRKDIDSPDFVLFYDEKGNPKGGGFGDHVFIFEKIEGDTYKAITYDKLGNNINEAQIELASSSKINQIVNPNSKGRGGPSTGNITFSVYEDEGILEWLQEQSRILNIVGCAVSLPSGLGAIGPCGVLLLDEILRVLPEDHAYYKDLVFAKEMLSFASFATPKGFLDKITTITGAMVTSVATIKELAEKYINNDTPNIIEPLISTTNKDYKKVECNNPQAFSGTMYIPIIVDHKEKYVFNDGRKNDKDDPKKEITIQVNMNAKDMCFSNSVFTGIIFKNDLVSDEVITYKGKVSKDKKKLEYIEITRDYTIYVLSTREDIEKTIALSVRFENIPVHSWGGYNFKYGVSKIVSVSFNEKYRIPRYGYVNTYTQEFVRINEEEIPKHYRGLQVNF